MPHLKALITGRLKSIGHGTNINFTGMFALAHYNHWLVKRLPPSPLYLSLYLLYPFSMKVIQNKQTIPITQPYTTNVVHRLVQTSYHLVDRLSKTIILQ